MEAPTRTPTSKAAVPTPTNEPAPTIDTPTPEPSEAVQEFAIIENYVATQFFPGTIEVVKDVPVKLYLTRLHREHVNQFAIEPFYRSNDVILPGEIGLIEFVPDRVGEFKIRNVGHGFEATLVVVETVAELKQLMVDRGVKMFALIQSANEGKLFPERTLVVRDVPVRVFNISLTEEHRVSVSPFYDPAELNVRPREITSFDFTPDRAGTFAIRSAIYEYQGILVVEDPG